jgi:general secretion pathway protein C
VDPGLEDGTRRWCRSLGLQNGNLLRMVNGVELTDPSSALQAYALLRSTSGFDVEVVRRGQPLTLRYVVR